MGGKVSTGHGQKTSWRYCLIIQCTADIRIKRALWSGWWMMVYVSCIRARWLSCWPHVSIMFNNRNLPKAGVCVCIVYYLFFTFPSYKLHLILGLLSTVLLTEYVQTVRSACNAAQSFYSNPRQASIRRKRMNRKMSSSFGVFQPLIEWPWNKAIRPSTAW